MRQKQSIGTLARNLHYTTNAIGRRSAAETLGPYSAIALCSPLLGLLQGYQSISFGLEAPDGGSDCGAEVLCGETQFTPAVTMRAEMDSWSEKKGKLRMGVPW